MRVLVRGLEFQGFQGITPEERTVGHRFSLDLTANVPDPLDDVIEETVDYAKLSAQAVSLCNAQKDDLVETACRRIGQGLLEQFPLIESITVRLVKLQPALSLSIREVGVEMEFTR